MMPAPNAHVLSTGIPRTPAERGLAEAFAKAAKSLPGTGWVGALRREAMQRFEATGLPTRRVESFKYTDLRERLKNAYPPFAAEATSRPDAAALTLALGPLGTLDAARLVFVDGAFAPEVSQLDALGDSAEITPLAPLLDKAPAWLESKFAPGRIGDENALTRLNTAFMTDGILLKIKPGKSAAKAVLIVEVRSSATPRMNSTRHIVAVEAGASLTLVEARIALPGASADGITNTLTDVTVADGATLHHVAATVGDHGASRFTRWTANVGADATYRAFQLTAGVPLMRNELNVTLAGENSRLDISGAFLARGTSHIDTTLVVDHTVKHCESRELFKGVLDDRARGVFQGKIIVRPGADKTDGKQMARALMLSEDAEFDSKPELEIYADDVACGHGATSAALDDDMMFYCRSRGIPEAEARALLIEAFIGDAIDKIESEPVREAFMEMARAWLSQASGDTARSTP